MNSLQVYQEQGIKDKERYKKEIEDYRKRMVKSQEFSEDSGNPRADGAALESPNGNLQQELGEANSCTPTIGNDDQNSEGDDDLRF